MKCKHISNTLGKINNLIEKMNDTESFLYEEKGPYVDYNSIETHLDESGNFFKKDYTARTTYGTPFSLNVIRGSILYDKLSEMFDELKDCDCTSNLASHFSQEFDNLSNSSRDEYNNLANEWNELKNKYNSLVEKYNNLSSSSASEYNSLKDKYNILVDKFNNLSKDSARDYNSLKEKYNNLVDEYNDKLSDYHEYKEKYEEIKEELNEEKLRHANEISNEKLKHKSESSESDKKIVRLEEKLEGKSAELIRVYKQLEDIKKELNLVRIESKNEIVKLENKLDEKSNQLITLRLESSQKDSILREKENELGRKNKEIEHLKSRAGLSQEELLTEKLRSEKRNLELFTSQLQINLEQIQSLSKYHERLFVARKNRNRANIDIHEENIARVKHELTNQGISMINIQEICQKCEKIAEFCWELEQMQQQFEARQEVSSHQ